MKNTLSSSLRLKRNSLLNLNNFFHINNNINIDNNEINEENDLINNNSPKRKSYIKHDISNVEKEKTRKK